jgi:type I restriction enzyme S subunit
MKAAELRKSILQAAVQGKLVPQDIHDEPASVLLERIRAEKDRLMKEGKIKKENPLPPITEDEIPYDLPEGWVWCRLNELFNFIDYRGKTPTKTNKGIPLITGANIKNGYMDYTQKFYISEEEYIQRLSRGMCQKGDILITTEAPLGHVALADKDKYSAGQRIITLQSYSNTINNELFMFFLLSPVIQQDIFNKRSGMTAYGIKGALLKLVLIPLPPFSEQERIVAKIKKLMGLCDELEAAEQELDVLESRFEEYLPKSILQAAVQGKLVFQDFHNEPASVLLERIRAEKARLVKEGKIKKEKPLPPISEDEIPYDLPEGWVWCRLGELCNFGVTISTIPDNIPDDAWVLELEDIHKDTGEIVQYKTKAERKSKSSKHVFYKGDVLYSKLRPYLNKVTIAEKDGYCSSEILPLQFCKDIYPQYAICFLRSPTFVDYAIERSYGVKMPRLGTEDGRNALFPLPPLAEQQRIVAKVNELMALCEEIKAVKTKPIEQRDTNKVIDFPAVKQDGQIQLAARGENGKKSSNELMQAIDEMFAGDE